MKYLSLIAAMWMVLPLAAQDVSKMSQHGQSAEDKQSRYVLELVRNGNATRLNQFFDKEPWQTQTIIDTYTNTAKTASIDIFCAAVDLGNLDYSNTFVPRASV